MPPFDDLFSKLKSGTKSAADQMNKAAKVAKLKMDILTLNSEKNKHLQTIGDRTYALFLERNSIDGAVLIERIRHELTQIERTEGKIKDLESQIADLQALHPQSEITDADEVTDVTEEPGSSEGGQQ